MRSWLALTLLVACKKPAPDAVRDPVDAAVAAVVDAGPPLPAASDDKDGILKSLCDAVLVTYPSQAPQVACDAHPPFAKKRAPGGPVPTFTGDDIGDTCPAEAVYLGSFTRAGAHEAVLSFGSCHEHPGGYTTSFANAMSVVLAEKVNGQWVEKAYDEGHAAEGCAKARRADGRDVLLCNDSGGAYSNGFVTWLSVYDFTQKQHLGTVARIFATDVNCNYAEMFPAELPRGSFDVKVLDRTVGDLNHDGNDDATFTIERVHAPFSKQDIARLQKGCAAQPQDVTLPAGRKTTTRLEVVSKGDTYVLAPASQAIVDTWTKETGDNLVGLRDAAPPPIWP